LAGWATAHSQSCLPILFDGRSIAKQILRRSHWQEGYGAFTVSKSAEEQVKKYIHQQEQHHKQWKFTEKFKALLEKHGIPYEEPYLWT
jgi:REP element-mobilizing transposase RayT